MKLIITGERGAGKSTLIARLMSLTVRPIGGFITKRLEPDSAGFHPVYIHPAGRSEVEREYSEANLVGACDAKTHSVNLAAFDEYGRGLLLGAPRGGVIIMDELGFMEARAEKFCEAVFDALAGENDVIAAVKSRFDVPFLNGVRSFPGVENYTLTPENREAIYELLSKKLIG